MQTLPKYKFTLEKHPSKKGTCPNCGAEKAFRYFENMEREYGICDRKNNCGYEHKPSQDSPALITKTETTRIQIVYPNVEFCNATIKNQTSNFHRFCISKLNITLEHLLKWNCGTIEDKTVFVYKSTNNKFLNMVHIEYSLDGKRNKSKNPYSLKANKGEKYNHCLYGEHLLSGKIICLVESEKTAIIASFFYPQFDWLATGGANKLTGEKINVLFGREIYYLCDADKAGRESSTIKRLEEYKQNFKVIDLFPGREDKTDLADYIIEGLRPKIKPTENKANVIKETQPLTEKRKNISDFEKVKNFLSDRYEIRFNEVSNEIEYRNKGERTIFEVLNENNIYIELQENFINFSQAKVTALLRSS